MFLIMKLGLHQLLNLVTAINGVDENFNGFRIGAREPTIIPRVDDAFNIPLVREVVYQVIANLMAWDIIRPEPTDLCKEYVSFEFVYLALGIQTDIITHHHSVEYDEILPLVHLSLALDEVHTIGAVEIVF